MAHQWHGKESRWGDRVKIHIPVQVSSDAVSRADGCIENLSLSGALLKADVNLGLHSLIEVNIPMPSPSQRAQAQAIMAYVSRKFEEGVGVEWCDFAPSIVKDLLRAPSIPRPF